MQGSTKKSRRKERGHGGKSSKQDLASAKDLNVELLEGHESP